MISSIIDNIKIFFIHTLWQPLPEQTNALKRWLIQTIRILFVVIRDVTVGQLSMRSMSLVYTTLLSIVPLIAVMFSVLKSFGVHNKLEPVLLASLEPLGEQGVEIAANILGFVQNIKVGVMGAVGLIMLFYTIIALISKIESAFNHVWYVKKPRTMARRITDYLSVIMIGPLSLILVMGLIGAAMNNDLVQGLQSIEPFGTLLLLLSKLIPYVMITLIFAFVYTFIPNTKVEIKAAFFGAIVAGILWVTTGTLFAKFVAGSSNYTAIYSSFAILFFFMIWIYLSWFILLVGSQVAFYFQHPELVRRKVVSDRLSPRRREQEGLNIMVLLAEQFRLPQKALSFKQIETYTGLPMDVLQRILTMLETDGLVAKIEGEEQSYQPAQDIETLQVQQILNCLRTAEEHNDDVVDESEEVADEVTSLLQRLTVSQEAVLANLSLRDLITESAQGTLKQ